MLGTSRLLLVAYYNTRQDCTLVQTVQFSLEVHEYCTWYVHSIDTRGLKCCTRVSSISNWFETREAVSAAQALPHDATNRSVPLYRGLRLLIVSCIWRQATPRLDLARVALRL